MEPTTQKSSKRRTLIAGLAAAGCTLGLLAAPPPAVAYPLQSEPSGQAFWAVNGPTIVRDSFENGQCTEWAALQRPDIVEAVTVAMVDAEIAQGLPENFDGAWPARLWPTLARMGGVPTGPTPERGALIVMQPGTMGAGPTGHIAYVQRVYRDGSFRISQMHAPRLGVVTHETLLAGAAKLAGVSFIY